MLQSRLFSVLSHSFRSVCPSWLPGSYMSINPSAACPGMISRTSGRTCSTISIPGVFFGSAISPYVLALGVCAGGIRCSKRNFVFLPDKRVSPPCGRTQEGEGGSRPAVLFSLYHSAPGRPFPPGNPMMPSALTSEIRKERIRYGQTEKGCSPGRRNPLTFMVGMTGLKPATPWSRAAPESPVTRPAFYECKRDRVRLIAGNPMEQYCDSSRMDAKAAMDGHLPPRESRATNQPLGPFSRNDIRYDIPAFTPD